MEFTYYGDILGISSAYELGFDIAKNKLNRFYNEVYKTLKNYCQQNITTKVWMFSDSLFIYGDNALTALEEIQLVYDNLLSDDILLRGAMVKGKLSFEIRTSNDNIEKQLPVDDVLVRATGLEKFYKGARLIIENELASEFLQNYPDWATNEGFQKTYMNYHNINNSKILKCICPTPDQRNYEYLYPITEMDEDIDYVERKRKLKI